MEEAVENGRGRWSTAIGLTLALVLLSIFDPLALVLLPLAILIVGLPRGRKVRWVLVGGVLWMLPLLLSGGALVMLSRGWGLILGAIYLAATLVRPDWRIVSRAIAAVAMALLLATVALVASGEAAELDALIRGHLVSVSEVMLGDLRTRLPNAQWLAEPSAAERVIELQAELFPALLALQSLAALALASWWVRRLGRSDDESFSLSRMRDFRFNDQLIWILIVGLLLAVAPFGDLSARIAMNALFFMGALYALRGLAVFVFLASGSRSIVTMALGLVALVVLYPIAFTAALIMGVGDTWLDVRGRVAAVDPT